MRINIEDEIRDQKRKVDATIYSSRRRHNAGHLDPLLLHDDLVVERFHRELRQHVDVPTKVFIKDGKWQVPPNERFAGWERIEGVEDDFPKC